MFTKRLRGFVQRKEQTAAKQPEGGSDSSPCARTLPRDHPRRIRDKDHLRFIARQPCLVCGRMPSQAHHIRYAQPRAMGRKPSDEWVVPLCSIHHRSLHDQGKEIDWWKANDINPITVAETLRSEEHTSELQSRRNIVCRLLLERKKTK